MCVEDIAGRYEILDKDNKLYSANYIGLEI